MDVGTALKSMEIFCLFVPTFDDSTNAWYHSLRGMLAVSTFLLVHISTGLAEEYDLESPVLDRAA